MITPFASIITVEELNAFLREVTKEGDDQYLGLKQALIIRCAAGIEKFTGIKLQSGVFSETFDGNEGTGFWLMNRPINSITSITQGGATVATTEYALKAPSNFVKFRNRTISGWQNYIIFENAGYGYTNGETANNVPQDMRDACLRWVARVHKTVTTKTHGVSAMSAADQSTTYFERGMPEDVKMLLQPYRLLLPRYST